MSCSGVVAVPVDTIPGVQLLWCGWLMLCLQLPEKKHAFNSDADAVAECYCAVSLLSDKK